MEQAAEQTPRRAAPPPRPRNPLARPPRARSPHARRTRLRRLASSLAGAAVVVLCVTFLAFLLSYLSPTDAATQYFSAKGVAPTAEELAAKRAELGLDRPFLVQYGSWLVSMLHADMGTSLRSGRAVADVMASSLPYTLALAASSLALTLAVSLPLGLLCARRKDGALDNAVRALSYVLCSTPSFFLALLLLYVLSVKLGLLPVSSDGPVGIVMPTLALALPHAAWYVRQIRALALAELSSGYVEGLRARGVRERTILFKHVLRNSLVPILALVGISAGTLLGGSAVVEVVFSWPGVGNAAVSAISSRDYAVIQAYALLMALVYLVVNWAVDLLSGLVDPRIRQVGP